MAQAYRVHINGANEISASDDGQSRGQSWLQYQKEFQGKHSHFILFIHKQKTFLQDSLIVIVYRNVN